MATDTAFVIGCLALVGSRIPQSLRVFMLSLAITDDIGAILVVAIGYSSNLAWSALALGACGCVVVPVMARLGIRSVPLYFLVGTVIWGAIDASGIHATIRGVVLGLLTPDRRWVSDDRLYALLDQVIAHPSGSGGSGATPDRRTLQVAEIAAREALSPLSNGWNWLCTHGWGLSSCPSSRWPTQECRYRETISSAHRGRRLRRVRGGQAPGVVAFTWLAVRSGIAIRSPDLGWRLVAGGGLARRHRLHDGAIYRQSGLQRTSDRAKPSWASSPHQSYLPRPAFCCWGRSPRVAHSSTSDH